jgi:hypothetical protein
MAEPPPDVAAPAEWVNVANFGASGDADQDATEALRRAVNSGAEILYLPHGIYTISDSIEIPSTLRKIFGMNSTIRVAPTRLPTFSRSAGMVRITAGGSPLAIERLAFDNSGQGDQLAVEFSGGRDVVLRDVVSAGVTLLDRKPTGGRIFLEDVCCGRIKIAGRQPAYARQLDTEGGGVRIINEGSPLSILGLKTEGVCTIVESSGGAHTDIFGGLVYVVRDGAGLATPAFRDTASWLAASFAEESLRPDSRYQIYLSRELAGGPAVVPVGNFPQRGFGRFVPELLDEP